MTLHAPRRSIRVRSTFVGFHHWPGATGERAYLGQRHRHEFTVTASLGVLHHDREVEFHDVQEFLAVTVVPTLGVDLQPFPGAPIELGSQSCEAVAERVAELLEEQWPGRVQWVAVDEDGQSTARLDYRIAVAGYATSEGED